MKIRFVLLMEKSRRGRRFVTVQFSYLVSDLIREYLYARKQRTQTHRRDVENTVD